MRLLALAVLAPALVWGQAMIEYGLNAGRAAGMGQGTKRIGKAAGDRMGKVGKSLPTYDPKKAAAPATRATPATTAAPVAAPEPPRVAAIDPAAIQVGLDRDELFNQFGKPSTRITQEQGGEVVEKCWYRAPGHAPVVVILRNGKVASAGS